MANHMKLCSCKTCRRGLHSPSGSEVARQAVRGARRRARQALRRGDTPDPIFGVGYTD